MTFAQINTKGRRQPDGEPTPQTNLVFRLDKVLDVATDSPASDRFLIRLQDAGEACSTSVVLVFAYPDGGEPPAITTDQVAAVNNNLIAIMNENLTNSYTSTAVDITDTILKGVVGSNGLQPYVRGVDVTSTQPSLA